MRTRRRVQAQAALLTGLLAASALLTGCASALPKVVPATTIDAWVHSGSGAEQETIKAQAKDFNVAQKGHVNVKLRVVQEGDYNGLLQSAVAAGTLPDVIELDGPTLASFNYQGTLVDLNTVLPKKTVAALLPSLIAQGTVDGRLVGAGAFDSGLGLYGNKRLLDAAGVKYPTALDDSWTTAQFTAALAALAKHDSDHLVLDLKNNYGGGEWLTYGFAPAIWSAGGDLIDRRTGIAGGVLDGPASVRAITQLSQWRTYVEKNTDDKSFTSGRTALSWVGHWVYPDYAAALKDDLVVLPLPDFGLGTKTGQGSWTWAVGADSAHSAAAGVFVNYLLSRAQVERTSTANGAVPGRTDVLAASTLYGKGGALERFGRQLSKTCGAGPITTGCISVTRPLTPAYPTISANVSLAIAGVMDGADPQTALTKAAKAIDADLAANNGYKK
ncbi:extracellular solute-binding protein [Pengzhenrongella sp.]|jgi:multiple sugar transport system substrate-binding protein|uniref:extracellular solute-binding protein n=1 Tax=Pengzhenrongella sp. TaxID=2888820 RepID=UPI002F93E61B